jgi:SAM-dependent methyltransferase
MAQDIRSAMSIVRPLQTIGLGVLDRLTAEPLYQPYKSRVAELLNPRAERTYLEVGSGTGAAAIALVETWGCRVLALDSSTAMTTQARSRGADAIIGDAHDLPFANDAFDGAWADRCFQHLADPVAALGEMIRVVKPGGVIVIADPDYTTQRLSICDPELATRVLAFRAEHGVRNGMLAHQMSGAFSDLGLVEVTAEEWPIVVRDSERLDNALGLLHWARFAAERGLIDRADVPRWEQQVATAASAGSFLYSFSIFITRGVRQ